jgi:predicted SAM-dependent methyltransferase
VSIPKRLHLGCGSKNIPGFYHIDVEEFAHLDRIQMVNDLSFIEDDSVELIYASHVLEHFNRHVYMEVLREWHRKLMPDGVLRLSVPDFAKTAKAYLDENVPTNGIRGLLGALIGGQRNEHDFHRMAFDRELLESNLLEVGFRECRLWDWRTTEHAHIDDFSQAYIPKNDKVGGLMMSLNLEAIK